MPIPSRLVERFYSTSLYPPLQALVTRASNLASFPLFDVLIVGVVVWLLWMCVRDLRRRTTWPRVLGRWLLRCASLGAALYIAFVLLWGMNYRRPPLAGRLARTTAGSGQAVRRLARVAVEELNQGHAAAHVAGAFDHRAIDEPLADAFRDTLRLLGLPERDGAGAAEAHAARSCITRRRPCRA